ncbi:hypothetical protein JCM10212_002962 [Sporobolomyces blumeae]
MPHNPFSSSHSTTASTETPNEPPPAYSSTAPQDASGHLAVPGSSAATTNAGHPTLGGRTRSDSAASLTSEDEGGERGLSAAERVSMEDSFRELPEGWRREFDPNSQHFFFVDTKATPPRSIWVHPFDDPDYLKAHPEHREASRLYQPPEGAPPTNHSSAHEPAKLQQDKVDHAATHGGAAASSTSNDHHHGDKKKDDRTLGRKLKDKMTGTTHEQRVAQRRKQKEEELKAYQAYLMRRQQIMQAQREGRYQPVYAAPATPYGRSSMYGGGYGYGSPYGGYGYGGGMYGRRPGMGMGSGMALGGGLLGGLLLGDMLF